MSSVKVLYKPTTENNTILFNSRITEVLSFCKLSSGFNDVISITVRS